VDLQIVEEGREALESYCSIPMAYTTASRLRPEDLLAGRWVELEMRPRFKDYDADPEERMSAMPSRFDLTNWTVLTALLVGKRVGGAIVVMDTAGFDMLEGRQDLAVLADIRIHPEWQGQGIGRALVQRAVSWSKDRGCKELKVETQDINVVACRFYWAVGFRLAEVHPNAYPPHLDEVQLIWRMPLTG
jgi:GNAT superfamily N-acetyltransferase